MLMGPYRVKEISEIDSFIADICEMAKNITFGYFVDGFGE
jgi:hypothetical protein